LDEVIEDDFVRWAVQRQIGGFQGRPGKLEDVCYSFWIGASLKVSIHTYGKADEIVGKGDLVDTANILFLLSSQSPLGGFGKEPDDYSDPYHSYLALAALALDSQMDLKPLEPRWNVSLETVEWMKHEMTT
jgi:geranylgeranyl transferase type-1 subunit beta